jgi:hypothetical protein
VILVLVAFLLLCCLAVIIGGKLGRRRKEQAAHATPPGVGMDGWLMGAVMVVVPAVWILALSLGWFSSVFRAMRSPMGVPRITQLTSSSATPVPLHIFGLGALLILGPLVIAYDLYFVSRRIYRKFGSVENG